jgi:hypothetical protein
MAKTQTNGKVIRYPFAALMQGARVDAYREEQQDGRLDVILEVQGLEVSQSTLVERGGRIFEGVLGQYVPLRLQFIGAETVRQNGFFSNLQNIPPDDPARTIRDMLTWVQPGKPETYCLFYMNMPLSGSLRFYAQKAKFQRLAGEPTPVELERDWSPPPPMRASAVPYLEELYKEFAGDPVTIQLNGRRHTRRLFVGGVENQGRQRPSGIDAVLNLGEEPSIWAKSGNSGPDDRWVHKGEGKDGMTEAEIRGEAQWVIERLEAGKSVLVHCVAGMNRSAAICCAVVMLTEGLSAEAALARVRAHHPFSRPDPNHWLKLRWMSEHR